MSDIKLYCGDCLDILTKFEENSIHAAISDIPYGISYEDWDVLHNNKNSALGGSTGVACKNLNRSFIGIEKEEKYFKIAEERILGGE